jgi:threonylcarbamoyladenosine tRNA methylthiotransferase MtaB
MKRRHLARDVVRFCDEARRRRPDIVFGADIIAGFPTETEAAHDATRAMIQRAGITYLHVFPFSPRNGTPAARMRQLDGGIIRRRAEALRSEGTGRLTRFLNNALGSQDQMLIEGGNNGHGRNYAKMHLQGDFLDPGALVNVRVSGREGDTLLVERQ